MGNFNHPVLGPIRISGDTPSTEEQARIDAAVAQVQRRRGVREQIAAEPRGFEPTLRRPTAEVGRLGAQAQAEQTEQQRLERAESIRSTVAPLVGGLAGLTAATGGVTAPVTAPAALAAAGGGAAASALSQLLPGQQQRTGREIAERAAAEGAFEGLTAGAGAVGLRALRAAGRRFASADEAALSLNQRFGINASLEDISTGGPVRGFRRVLGQVPTQAAPFRRSARRRASDLSGVLKQLTGRIAPVGTALDELSESAIGNIFNQRGTAKFKSFMRQASKERERLESTIAADPNAFIQPEFLKDASRRLLDANTDEIISARNPASRLATRILERSPRTLTIKQYKSLQKSLQVEKAKAARLTGGNKDAIIEDIDLLEKALEKDFLNIQGSEEIGAAIREFNDFYSSGIAQFESPVARSFSAVDRNVFRPGFTVPGSQNPDELAIRLFRQGRVIDSPTGVRDLRNLVGEDAFRRGASTHLQNQIDNALAFEQGPGGQLTGNVSLDLDALKNSLGLFRPRSGRRNATEEMLRGTGVSAKQLEEFFTLVDDAAKRSDAATSQFLARRIALGGGITGAGVAGGFAAGGGLGAGLGGILALAAARGFGEAITSPGFLSAARFALRPNVPQTAVAQQLVKAGRAMGLSQDQIQQALQQAQGEPSVSRASGVAPPAQISGLR